MSTNNFTLKVNKRDKDHRKSSKRKIKKCAEKNSWKRKIKRYREESHRESRKC